MQVGQRADKSLVFIDVFLDKHTDQFHVELTDDDNNILHDATAISSLSALAEDALVNLKLTWPLWGEPDEDFLPLAPWLTCENKSSGGGCGERKELHEFLEERNTGLAPFRYCMACREALSRQTVDSDPARQTHMCRRQNYTRRLHDHQNIWSKMSGAERSRYLLQYYLLRCIDPEHLRNADDSLYFRTVLRERAAWKEGDVWRSFQQVTEVDPSALLEHAHGRIRVGKDASRQDLWLRVQADSVGAPLLRIAIDSDGPDDPHLTAESLLVLDPYMHNFLHSVKKGASLLNPPMPGLGVENWWNADLEHYNMNDFAWATCDLSRREELLAHVYIEINSRHPLPSPNTTPMRKMWIDAFPTKFGRLETWIPW